MGNGRCHECGIASAKPKRGCHRAFTEQDRIVRVHRAFWFCLRARGEQNCHCIVRRKIGLFVGGFGFQRISKRKAKLLARIAHLDDRNRYAQADHDRAEPDATKPPRHEQCLAPAFAEDVREVGTAEGRRHRIEYRADPHHAQEYGNRLPPVRQAHCHDVTFADANAEQEACDRTRAPFELTIRVDGARRIAYGGLVRHRCCDAAKQAGDRVVAPVARFMVGGRTFGVRLRKADHDAPDFGRPAILDWIEPSNPPSAMIFCPVM